MKELGTTRLAAVKRKAKELGTTPQAYLKQLLDEDLELNHLVATRSMTDLSRPVRDAFRGTDEDEIGRLVEAARKRNHRRLSKR